jgi:hypothetical protein
MYLIILPVHAMLMFNLWSCRVLFVYYRAPSHVCGRHQCTYGLHPHARLQQLSVRYRGSGLAARHTSMQTKEIVYIFDANIQIAYTMNQVSELRSIFELYRFNHVKRRKALQNVYGVQGVRALYRVTKESCIRYNTITCKLYCFT